MGLTEVKPGVVWVLFGLRWAYDLKGWAGLVFGLVFLCLENNRVHLVLFSILGNHKDQFRNKLKVEGSLM